MKKRILALILSLSVILPAFNTNLYAAIRNNADKTDNTDNIEDVDKEDYIISSYHGELEYEPTPLVGNDDISRYTATDESNIIPDKYITDNLPDVRNQNPYGTCWAFGATALAELSLLKKDVALDLSELQLIYFTNHTPMNPLGGTEGDSSGVINLSNMLNEGGNQLFAMQSYANWIGAVDEKKVPYEEANTVQSNGLEERLAFDDAAHIKNAYIINMKTDAEEAKKLIMENGAVGISYYDDANYYQSNNTSYYCNTQKSSNHAVAIVGWDDNFPKENFSSTPETDGAWLVRNSWGDNEYSRYGYFWLSYCDKSIDKSGFSYEFVSDQNSKTDEFYDNNYYYDGCVYPGYTSKSKAANVFCSQKGKEKLKAISFGTGKTCENYNVKVYKNLTDENNPESGTLVSSAKGSTTFEGIYTVKLDEEVLLEYGDTFSVVVELEGKDGTSFMIEATNTISWFSATSAAKAGQSFYKSTNWVDYGKTYNRNIRIKAFTDTIREEVVFPAEDDIEINVSNEELTFTKENGKQNFSVNVIDKVNGKTINCSTVCELSQEAVDAGYTLIDNEDGTYSIELDLTKEINTSPCQVRVYAVDYDQHKTTKFKSVKLIQDKVDIGKYSIELNYVGQIYNGNEIKPSVKIKAGDSLLCQTTDYDVSYINNINAGEATAIATGKGWYKGQLSVGYSIAKANKYIYVSGLAFNKKVGEEFLIGASTVAGEKLIYSSSDTSVVTVDENGKVKATGAGQATITISSLETTNFNSAADAKVIVTVEDVEETEPGTENEPEPESPEPETPQPETPQPESPEPESPEPETPQPETPQPESPEPETPEPETPQPETPQPESPEPETPQPESPQPETPQPGIQEKGIKVINLQKTNYIISAKCKSFKLKAKIANGEKLYYSSSDNRVVTVSTKGKVTVKGIGTAVITITSPESANYKAAAPVKMTITIIPKSVRLSAVKNVKKKSIKVLWKKDTSVTGYEIMYSQKSNFKGTTRRVIVTKNKTVSATIKKLTKNKIYYVKIRAYKTVKGKKIYGAYSSIKRVKVTK